MSSAKRRATSILWSERALSDLRAIDDYIGRHDPRAAERWVNRLLAKAEQAARSPLGGRRVPERANADLRETYLRSYRLVYRVRDEGIVIVTIFEGHRRFPSEVD